MPERTTGAGRPGAQDQDEAAEEIRRLRRDIDRLDRRIVALLNARAALGLEVGRAKAAAGRSAIRDLGREQAVLEQVAESSRGPLPAHELEAIYRRIMAATRRLESAERRAGQRERDARAVES